MKFTQQESKALSQLIDIAVRAEGMKVAEAATHLLKKIEGMTETPSDAPQAPSEGVKDKSDPKVDKDIKSDKKK